MNTASVDAASSAPGALPLLDFRLLWHRKGTFVLFACLTTALGVAYLAIEKPTYEVTRRVLVETDRLAAEEVAPTMPSRQFAPTQAELVRSPKVLKRAMEKAPLTIPASAAHDPMGFVLEALAVTPVVDTSVLKIRFRGNDRDEAARFVDAVVESYREVLKEKQDATVDSLKDLLVQEEVRRRDELAKLKAGHVELVQRSPYPAHLQENARVESEQLLQLERQLAEVQLRKTQLATRLSQVRQVTELEVARAQEEATPANLVAVVKYEEGINGGKPSEIRSNSALAESRLGRGLSSEQNLVFELLRDEQGKADGVLAEVQRQLTQAHVRRQQLSVQYGPKHDAMRQVDAEIQRLEHMLHEQLTSLMDTLSQRLQAEQQAELELQDRCDAQEKEVKALDSFMVEEESLRTEIKRSEAAYDIVFNQLKQVSLSDEAVTSGRGTITVVDLESGNQVPPKVWPLPAPLLGMSFAAGLFVALMWIYSGAVIQASSSPRAGASEALLPTAAPIS
ncbi:MAG: Wzz/FepE/Etk N-terminal domain-containing protein [Pirellulales bacterium]